MKRIPSGDVNDDGGGHNTGRPMRVVWRKMKRRECYLFVDRLASDLTMSESSRSCWGLNWYPRRGQWDMRSDCLAGGLVVRSGVC